MLDRHKRPLMPCSEKRARQLLERGRAVVHRVFPFTIRLKDRLAEESAFQPLRLKLDPGAAVTGFAVLLEGARGVVAVLLGEIHHRADISGRIRDRAARRRSRRGRKVRYREPRFQNRRPEKCAACGKNARRGSRWCRPCERAGNRVDNGHRGVRLPASLEARVLETVNAVEKLLKLLPVTALSVEHAKFDTQKLQDPEISGVEYQQGELFGYEVKEYLLEKWGRECVYCGATGVPLEVEHVVPKNPRSGPRGTDRVSNLVISCRACNKAKGNKQPGEWLEELQESGRPKDRVRAERLKAALERLKEPLVAPAYTAGRESPRVNPWDESPANFLAGMSSLYCINLVQCSYGTEIQTQTHVRIAGQLPLCLVPALQA